MITRNIVRAFCDSRNSSGIVLVAASLLLLGGCSVLEARREPLPTLFVIPTLTPSNTPTPTILAPTETVTPSAAPTVTPPPSASAPLVTAGAPSATPSDVPTVTETPITATPIPLPPSGPAADLRSVQLGLEQITRGLRRPVALADAGGFAGRLYVVEKGGAIRIVENGFPLPTPFLDISDKVASDQSENGLLGLAFHPNYLNNGFFYIYYSNLANQTILARYSVTGNPNLADKNSETVLLTFEQPTPEHNSGQLTFGQDGYLYVGLGDGGGIGDEYNNGQNGRTLLGAILRLDVDGGSPYGIPPDNPFVGDPNFRDEIWAYGLRNPWGFALDRESGDWYIADAGETKFEEINVQPAGVVGQNYGWPRMEGKHCYPDGKECEKPGMVSPVYEYTHTEGCAAVGGFVYRGQRFPALDGTYLFGDYCKGQIWALRKLPSGGWEFVEMSAPFVRLSAFGQDRNGEVYVLDYKQGAVYWITVTS